ncbi:acetyl-CoA synthetase-like protein [Setomelanomma holmii]|uniref:Acetyl-CoA synthetase-like protein n=1 Tax=Setomelanomma holmii TaxID=210430 RepID=A0A9P4LRB3_9PLEO|nr:acetyl-CoA synthetase-like protein [Setomelanomma holmii]
MATPVVLVSVLQPGLVRLTLNRPSSLNAINVDLLDELTEALCANQDARIILIDATGDRSFYAGENLKEILAPKTGSAEELRNSFNKLQHITRLTSSSSAVVVAAVQGFAIGHSWQAITGGITLRLTQIVGLLKAKEVLITGRWVGAEEALKLGLLSEIANDPKHRAKQLAVELAGLPAVAMASSKMQLERAVFPNMEACLQDEVNVASCCFAQSDASKPLPILPHERLLAKTARRQFAIQHAVNIFPGRTFLRMAGADISFEHDKVLVMMRSSVEMVFTWLATNRLGAVFVPINVELKSITLKHVVEAANAKLIIVDAELSLELQTVGFSDNDSIYAKGGDDTPMDSFSRLMDAKAISNTHAEVTPATTAAFLYTNDVLYCPFPLFHADATALTVVPAILLGAVAALSTSYSASRFWDEIRDTGATVYDFMGATLALTCKQPQSSCDRDHKVRLVWGVPIPHFAKVYEERFGHPLFTLYGSVEASLPIFQPGNLPAGSCDRLRDGFQLCMANDMDEDVPPKTPGHLLLRSDQSNSFFDGYYGDAANTASALRSLWLHTGDLAKVDEAGNVYFLGRVKDVIRRRGEIINAAEVEEEFLLHPDVVIATAYGVPSSFGEGTEEDADERELWEWARAHLARFQVPDVIELVNEIKRTSTGKIEKHGLGIEGGVKFDRRPGARQSS